VIVSVPADCGFQGIARRSAPDAEKHNFQIGEMRCQLSSDKSKNFSNLRKTASALRFTAMAQPASADSYDYTVTRSYQVPMSRTVRRTYTTVNSVPASSFGTSYISDPAPVVVPRVITSPVLIERPVVSEPIFVERTIKQPVLIERTAPVTIERTTAPVVIERRPVKIKKDSHHPINFGVWPLKLKVL